MILRPFIKKIVFSIEPRSLIVRNGARSSNMIYITFDDGPHFEYTENILNILKLYGIPATFFLSGYAITKNPELVKRILQSGHEVGNHTFGHILTSHLEFNKGLSDLRKNDILLRESFNIIPKYIRPPFGKITFPILFYALQKSQKIIMWSFDSRDSFLKNDSDLMQGLEKVKSGDILLFHDDTEITSKMLSHIIRRLLKNGFCFGSLNHIA